MPFLGKVSPLKRPIDQHQIAERVSSPDTSLRFRYASSSCRCILQEMSGLLKNLRIAVPCPAGLNMGADERVRYCSQCNLNVYNLSAMSSLEAEQLIAERQENVCVFFYRRKDGSIFTRGRPGKMRVVMRRTSRIAGIALSAVMSVSPLAAQATTAREAQVVRTESGLELTVVDPQGAICPGAKVDFTGNDFHRERVTDAAGLLRLLLPPGTYTLNISCYGFKPYQKTVVVEAQMSAETKAALEAGATAGTPIMVEAPPIPVVPDKHPHRIDSVPVPAKPGFFKRVWRKLSDSMSSRTTKGGVLAG